MLKEIVGIRSIIGTPKAGNLPELLTIEEVAKVKNFHLSLDNYKATPLARLDNLANKLGVSKIFVKDESHRFGLKAFKGLGGTYAVARLLCEKLDVDIAKVDFNYLKSPEIRAKIGDACFTTATAGNHGKGVAWAAVQLGYRAVIYVPKGTSQSRVDAIRAIGAEVIVSETDYDTTVRQVKKIAEEKGWHLVQDTAWEGYEKIPGWITQGYTTMADEALEQLKLEGIKKPTHVFLQAGVGSMAGSVLGYYANRFEGQHPRTIVVEPSNADCVFQTAAAGSDKPQVLTGEINTIMAGLACGEANPVTWKILRDLASAYVACPDWVSARGMRILGNPQGSDPRVISGESGAVGVGLLSLVMERPELADLRKELQLDENSVVLLFSTEGDTNPENYRDIVYDGKYPSML